MKQLTIKEQILKFLDYTDKKESGCMIWKGGVSKNSKTPQGYVYTSPARFSVKIPRYIYTHVFNKGKDLKLNEIIKTTCGESLCIHPKHLKLIPLKEYILTTNSYFGSLAKRTRCPKGHEYTKENTYISPKGGKACRACGKTAEIREKLVNEIKICTNGHTLALSNTYLNKKLLICKVCESSSVSNFYKNYPIKNRNTELGILDSGMEYFFFSRLKIDKKDCWNWEGNTSQYGYGVWNKDGKNHRTHRISYNLYVGEIENGKVIDHLCRNRKCANPNHLEAVTIGENVLRGETLAAKNKNKTHCNYGHEFTKENTRVTRQGRACSECKRIRDRKRWKEGKIVNKKVETCPSGHKYVEGSYKLDKIGRRRCLLCQNMDVIFEHFPMS